MRQEILKYHVWAESNLDVSGVWSFAKYIRRIVTSKNTFLMPDDFTASDMTSTRVGFCRADDRSVILSIVCAASLILQKSSS